jgi:hypothetical protein
VTTDIVAHVLDPIPFALDTSMLLKRIRVKADSALADEVLSLAEQGAQVARPRALYMVAYITGRGEDFVDIEGYRFTSRVLRVNTEHAFRVFPYLVTCGVELEAWAAGCADILQRFWADTVSEMAMLAATRRLTEHIEAVYRPGDMSSMNPGSLADWPIEQQRVLFTLLGDGVAALQVRLTESMTMVPAKTVSGIRFPTSVHFESCQLCPREHCPGRRAEYEPGLYQHTYAGHQG